MVVSDQLLRFCRVYPGSCCSHFISLQPPFFGGSSGSVSRLLRLDGGESIPFLGDQGDGRFSAGDRSGVGSAAGAGGSAEKKSASARGTFFITPAGAGRNLVQLFQHHLFDDV